MWLLIMLVLLPSGVTQPEAFPKTLTQEECATAQSKLTEMVKQKGDDDRRFVCLEVK